MGADFYEMPKTSKINSGMLITLRLNDLWNDANRHKRNGEYLKWNGDLDSVWCELGGDVKPNGKEEKELEEINFKLAQIGSLINWNNISSFKGISKEALNKKAKQYYMLMKKELFLRRLQNLQGKGTAYSEDDDDFE